MSRAARSSRGLAAAQLFLPSVGRFPSTRYQGSKRKLAAGILRQLDGLSYRTVLDAFGGTGAVSHAFKCAGKAVTYNDSLAFNHQIGLALIENANQRLEKEQVEALLEPDRNETSAGFIERTFRGIYFTDDENRWLDLMVHRIRRLEDQYQRAMAWYGVFQSALAKRPYNLFHRKNLYMRQADVPRGFGNKASWDRPFDAHFRRHVKEGNESVVDSGVACRAICRDALTIAPEYDLVYIDTPYLNLRGVGVDYRRFYHFLEGLVHYDEWPEMIDPDSAHRCLQGAREPWSDSRRVGELFRELLHRFRDSILVVSYRSNGIPSPETIAAIMREVKTDVEVIDGPIYQYALSTTSETREVLILGLKNSTARRRPQKTASH